MKCRHVRGFTIIELLVVIGVIMLLIGILIPAISRARDTARQTVSAANLRNLATAHANYASAWNGRQLTYVDDNMVSYGLGSGPNPPPASPTSCVFGYQQSKGRFPPPLVLGRWSEGPDAGIWSYRFSQFYPQNHPLLAPLVFSNTAGDPELPSHRGFGWFRLYNGKAFSEYLGGRFYDPVFYAPKDTVVMDYVRAALDSPAEYMPAYVLAGPDGRVGLSSYSLSPAALFSSQVLASPAAGGFRDPWSLPTGLRTPTMAQIAYPGLKTHMIEHHWLQNRRTTCNPAFDGYYADCQPWYFNHSFESQPQTLFYDASVRSVGIRDAERDDARSQVQSGHGLWSRDTPFGTDGYYISAGYDQAATSFHILTTDGARGRDFTGGN